MECNGVQKPDHNASFLSSRVRRPLSGGRSFHYSQHNQVGPPSCIMQFCKVSIRLK